MAHLTRPAEISGVSAGSFPETAAGNRAYVTPCKYIFFVNEYKYLLKRGKTGTESDGDKASAVRCPSETVSSVQDMFVLKQSVKAE